MSRFNTREAGFTHVAAVLVVLVFGAIGAIGYALYANPATSDKAKSEVVRVDDQVTIPAAPEIKSADDIDTALDALDKVDPDKISNSDSASLERQTNGL